MRYAKLHVAPRPHVGHGWISKKLKFDGLVERTVYPELQDLHMTRLDCQLACVFMSYKKGKDSY